MKLTQIALFCTIALLAAAGYLLLDSKNSKEKEQLQNQINELRAGLATQRQQPPILPAPAPAAPAPETAKADPTAQPAAPTAAPAPGGTAKPGAPTENGSVVASAQANPAVSPDPALPDPAADLKVSPEEQKILDAAKAASTDTPRLNEKQLRLKNLPAIAKVKTFNEQHSFVVIDAGTNRGLEKGMKFSVRRDAMLIGKAVIGETVDNAESVADIDPKSIPVGVVLQAGDELVQYD